MSKGDDQNIDVGLVADDGVTQVINKITGQITALVNKIQKAQESSKSTADSISASLQKDIQKTNALLKQLGTIQRAVKVRDSSPGENQRLKEELRLREKIARITKEDVFAREGRI